MKILGGDFNLVLDLSKDKIGGRLSTNDKAAQFLCNQIQIDHLIDAWRIRNSEKKMYTWYRNFFTT